jgi:hypothetical protein
MLSSEIEYFGLIHSLRQGGVPFNTETVVTEPVHALTYLKNTYGKMDTFKCPSFIAQMKNTYYITSPIDFTLRKVGEDHWSATNDRPKTASIQQYFDVGMPESKTINGSVCMNFGIQYYFVNKKDNVVMEVFDPPLVHLPLTNVTGQFNISKWFRPTNFTFFLDPGITTVSFKRGQPLYAVRFNTNKTVKLSKIHDLERRDRLLQEQMKATALKDFYPGLKLEEMYDMFKHSMKRIFK